MLRTALFLNALLALISTTGLCMNFVTIFKPPVSQSKEYNLQCWTWLGTFIVSISLCIIVVFHLLYFRHPKHKRISTTTSLFGFIVTLAACIIFDDKTSWEDKAASVGGLFLHCAIYDNEHDSSYPTLYQRCVLTDATWISGLLLCFLWLAMFFVMWYSPTRSSAPIYKYQVSDTNAAEFASVSTPRLEHFSYLPTKALPSVQQRSSDDNTLYLPIHGNTTLSTPVIRDTNTLQPQDEKLQVSELWDQTLDHSNLTLTTSCSSTWMKSLDQYRQGGPITGSRRIAVAHSCPEFNKKRMKTLLTALPRESDPTPFHY